MDISKLAGGSPSKLTGAVNASGGEDGANAAQGFGSILKKFATQAVDAQNNAQAMSMAAARGDNVPLQDVVTAIGQAELTLQTLVSVRDKAIEAYQEVMRMPI